MSTTKVQNEQNREEDSAQLLEAEPEPVSIEPVVPPRVRSRTAHNVDMVVSKFLLGWTGLGVEFRRFSRRLEEEIFPAARRRSSQLKDTPYSPNQEDEETVLEFSTDLPGPYERVGNFLAKLGIRLVRLDADLESVQVLDVLQLLWACRRGLAGDRESAWGRMLRRDAPRDALLSDRGGHVSCSNVRLVPDQGLLRVKNSYCTLTFSRAATVYMKKYSHFPDHRAFFHAAPRYGLLVTLVAFLPVVLGLWVWTSPTVVVFMEAGVAVLLGACTMIILETIGAVQYDKEHQAKELARRHKALMKAHNQIEADLDRAGHIQRKLVPNNETQPFPDHVRLAHSFAPQMAVGGDYYDFRAVSDNLLALLFVDVSGHGMSGAFVTGIIKTACDMGLLEECPPGEFLKTLNQVLERMTPLENFAAVVFGLYDVSTHELVFANAGHHPLPFVVRSDGTVEEAQDSSGTVLGFDPSASFEQSSVKLSAGDRFILCTDGITECANEAGERFGLERLRQVLADNMNMDVEELPDKVLEAVNAHCGKASQDDDRTILSMEVIK